MEVLAGTRFGDATACKEKRQYRWDDGTAAVTCLEKMIEAGMQEEGPRENGHEGCKNRYHLEIGI